MTKKVKRFWAAVGKGALAVLKIGALAVAKTAASGKPITLGNIGRDAGTIVVEEVNGKEGK